MINKNRHNFCMALSRFQNIVQHTKNYEFELGSNHYYFDNLQTDIKETKKALDYAQENYLVYDALYELIVANIEIENLYEKYGIMDFNSKFHCSEEYAFKFFGNEIKVIGYDYIEILDWVLKQRRKIGEKDGI